MQNKDDIWDNLYVYAKEQADRNISFSDIEHNLKQKTNDTELINEVIKQVKKVHYAVKRKRGLTKVLFGVLFLFAGFAITFINFHSNQSFTIVMYSFTTIGLGILFWGLYEAFG